MSWWNRSKKKQKKMPPVQVTVLHRTGAGFRVELENVAQVKHVFLSSPEMRYDKWFMDDADDSLHPPLGLMVTNLKLNKGQLEAIEFTETYDGGINEC